MNAASGADPSSPVLTSLQRLHRELAMVTEGRVATYIPELAKADPRWFGLCLVTTNGSVYEVGDSRIPFTIQSISKPFVYGLALEDNGRQSVLEKVGVEPTGDAFNSISLEPGTGRPRNPMINAGAIATTGLIAGKTPEIRLRRVLESLGQYAGRDLTLDQAVYSSESGTGHRNRAIGYMLRNFEILTDDPMPVVDLYFRQCSIAVSVRDLAVMAATLANRGTNPVTGKQALRGEYVESVLSVMETCGMYDFAGQWVYQVGMPAKSGVAGGLIAVLPGQLGIGVFSPPLDDRGNSVRGIRVCQDLSRYLDLHLLNRPAIGRMTVRHQINGAAFNSNRVRTRQEMAFLRSHGQRIQLYQLQGNLTFSTMEIVVGSVTDHLDSIEYAIFDLRRVLSINESACHLFLQLLQQLASRGKATAFTHEEGLPLLRRYLRRKLGGNFEAVFKAFPDNDRALEWAEDQVLNTLVRTPPEPVAAGLPAYEVLRDLTASELPTLASLLEFRNFRKGDILVEIGAAAEEMFFLARGSVSVLLPHPSGPERRLATFSAGMSFGEMAMLDRAPRSARIVADTEGACHVFSREAFEALACRNPSIMVKVLRNLCLNLSSRLRKANAELGVLD